MQGLVKLLDRLPAYNRMKEAVLNHKTPALLTGVSTIHKAHFIFALVNELNTPALVLTPDEAAASKLCEEINAFFGSEQALLYPARDFTFRAVDGVSREYEHARLGILGRVLRGEAKIVVAGAEAALQCTIEPERLLRNTKELRVGKTLDLQEFLAYLTAAGYESRGQIEGRCQFSFRGGIVDVFPANCPAPVRMELWDDEIDSLSYFDIETQRRTEPVESVRVFPAREVLIEDREAFIQQLKQIKRTIRTKQAEKVKENIDKDLLHLQELGNLSNVDKYLPILYQTPATLFDYMQERLLFFSESSGFAEALKNSLWQTEEDIKQLFEEGILFKGCDRYYSGYSDLLRVAEQQPCLLLDTFARTTSDFKLRELLDLTCVQLSGWGGEYGLLKEDLEGYRARNFGCVVLAGTEKNAQALAGDLIKDGFQAVFLPNFDTLAPGQIVVAPGSLSAGLEYPEIGVAVLSHTRVAAGPHRRRRKAKRGEQIRSLSEISPGDLVVHASHGIGVFEGIVKQEIQGIAKDYIKIRYAGTDTLFVPVTQLDLVSRYIGAKDDGTVRLSRLNSAEWSKTKQRVKSAVADMAKELIRLYSERMKMKGFAFSPDSDWQRDFEERFEYDETDDQLRCIDEIKTDMESQAPMERLLCGDVGFGKTEVALRAIFKAVMDSKQCAVLVPTTILAWQHYQTFRRRMEGFPIRIELLSRFRTPKQQQQVVRELKRGQVDVIIGTHRLLQKDIEFKDLGLLVIDEEQRFGVAHKEKLKELRKNIDVLLLSATPIPRTLNMAMSGIRDMSVIEEAPQDRYPVQSYVVEYDDGLIGEAIKKELRRGGQVFYLHNRVESIEGCAAHLAQLVPDARIVTAHGKMGEEALSAVWKGLLDHEIDILVCTTIIETGVDVPNCNTLIIEDADNFGLSQLYQLRGRVGRSNRRAFAYFTFRRGKQLSDVATKRLSAIREFTAFGLGFRIAMRDLEIRGAGNVLGAQQHGHMEAVGYDMYIRLLSEAIAEQKGEALPSSQTECLVDIRVGAHIPESYIADLGSRIDVYKKIAAIRNDEDASDVLDELIDRFGDPPKAVQGLVDVSLVRNQAAAMGITEISQRTNEMVFHFERLQFERVGALSGAYGNRVTVNTQGKPTVSLRLISGDNPLPLLRKAVGIMSDAMPQNAKSGGTV